jgi:KaiC/GvpD/RAD55 family RecA-like ATPase
MAEEYGVDLQKLYLEFLQADKELFVRCNAIIDSEYFDRSLRSAVRFMQEHVEKYGDMPTLEQMKVKGSVELQDLRDNTSAHQDWFLDEFEKFCKHKGLEKAILASTDKLEKGEFGAVEMMIKDAVGIGLAKELGSNYWDDPAGRIQSIKDNRGQNSTGWKTMDTILYGGFNPGELNIFAGGSGSGKSLFMQNMALNWSLAGKNVVYVSLELSEELCGMRIDAMVTGMSTRDVMRNADDAALKVKMKGKKAGVIQTIQMPNGATINDIKAYIKEVQIQMGIKVDALFVDYLDLMMPVTVKVNPSDQFIKDKFVSEELRNLATELNILFVTASQLNRGSVDEVEFDHSHIAGGISKINTADNVIGIFTSRAMRERGRAQIQFMKTRSSSGVGSKLDLDFNIETLRITDLDEDAEDSDSVGTSAIYDKLKRQNGSSNDSLGISQTNNIVESAVDNTDRLRSILKRAE